MRGRENLNALKKDTIGFKRSEDGKEAAYIKVPLLRKNVKPLKSKEYDDMKCARMDERPDFVHCPVKRLHQYLNEFQVQRKDNTSFPKCNENQNCFSLQMVLGKDKYGSLLKTLSEKAKLSKQYARHKSEPVT